MAVAGEPSLGTPHPHYKRLVDNFTTAAGAGYTTVDLSTVPEVSVGAKMIYIGIAHDGGIVNEGLSIFTDVTPTPVDAFMNAKTLVLGQQAQATGLVLLSSTRTFVYYRTNQLSGVYIIMYVYWN